MKYSCGDVTLTKENDNYTVMLHHIYIVYLSTNNENKINLKKYITFDQIKENIKLEDLFKLSGLHFGVSEDDLFENYIESFTPVKKLYVVMLLILIQEKLKKQVK